MDDLALLRKAVEENLLEDAPLAALVDALTEAGLEWEAEVRKRELELRRKFPGWESPIRDAVAIKLERVD